MQAVHGLFIHGVGTQPASFSDAAQKHLAGACSEQGAVLYAQAAHWAPVLDREESKMMKAVAKRGSSNRPAQRLVIETLADALCYRNKQDAIFDVIDQSYARLRSDEVTIFAHSLGALLAVEWLRSRASVRPVKLVTFGCNLELFHLGGEFYSPAQLARPGVWVNCFDEDDMLGWPLRGWLPQVEDVEVSVGGFFTGWTGLAHIGYFDDKKFWRRTVPQLIL